MQTQLQHQTIPEVHSCWQTNQPTHLRLQIQLNPIQSYISQHSSCRQDCTARHTNLPRIITFFVPLRIAMTHMGKQVMSSWKGCCRTGSIDDEQGAAAAAAAILYREQRMMM
jgi:hypothetical protein